MATTRIPAYTYEAPAAAGVLTIGLLFLFTYVLPTPSHVYPVGPFVYEEPEGRGYIEGVQRPTSDAVELTLHVSSRLAERNATAEYLSGLLFENIAHSGDGGLYAELIRNRAFQGSGIRMGKIPNLPYSSIVSSENPTLPSGPVLDGWSGIGDVRIGLDLLHPLSEALQVALQVDIPLNATGEVGIQNDGWWGINVSPQFYQASFYAQADGERFNWTLNEFEVSLRSTLENKTWCSQKIPISQRLQPYDYAHFNTTLPCATQAPNVNNTFAITFDAKEAAGRTIYFDLVSLFPETFKGRRNGLRKDLAEHLAALKPKFLRFPGGNNLEGYSTQRRWKWWKTIGDLKDRPGPPGDWSYYNTDGLGLLEYLEWCEDMEIEPLLAIYAGFSLNVQNYNRQNSSSANEWPMSQMPEVLKEALDELEYCMGSNDTYWGKLRASHGHPDPFEVKMVEIGNEDFFSYNYPARALYLYEGLKAHYPDITYVFAASINETFASGHELQILPGSILDSHLYEPTSYFIQNFDVWDHFQKIPGQTKVFGSPVKYHATTVGAQSKMNKYPHMGTAVAEAVFTIAGERNPNVFRLSCFAPLMQNLNAYRGTPYNILFTSDPADTVLSASYFQQQLFNSYQGKQILPTTVSKGGINPLYWAASVDNSPYYNKAYFKVVNAGNLTQSLRIELDAPLLSEANGTIIAPPLAGDLYTYNWEGNHILVPRAIEDLKTTAFGEEDGRAILEWRVPAFSIAVLEFDFQPEGQSNEHETATSTDDEL